MTGVPARAPRFVTARWRDREKRFIGFVRIYPQVSLNVFKMEVPHGISLDQ